MRGSPFFMPVYGGGGGFLAGVCGCEKRHAAWWRGGVLPLMLVCGGLRCEAAGVVMGVAGAWLGGAAGCVTECADLCIGTRGRNIERQGRGEQRKTLRSGIKAWNATQRIGKEQKIPAFGRSGRCWKIWIFIDLTKLRQSFLSVLTI